MNQIRAVAVSPLLGIDCQGTKEQIEPILAKGVLDRFDHV